MDYLCITCCQINKHNKKSLPVRCPKTNTICFAINPRYVSPEFDAGLIEYVMTHLDPQEPIPRIEMDSKFMDAEFIAMNCKCFEKMAEKGDKGVYCAEAY